MAGRQARLRRTVWVYMVSPHCDDVITRVGNQTLGRNVCIWRDKYWMGPWCCVDHTWNSSKSHWNRTDVDRRQKHGWARLQDSPQLDRGYNQLHHTELAKARTSLTPLPFSGPHLVAEETRPAVLSLVHVEVMRRPDCLSGRHISRSQPHCWRLRHVSLAYI